MPVDLSKSQGVVVDLSKRQRETRSPDDGSREETERANRWKRFLWRRRKLLLREEGAQNAKDLLAIGE